jgi:hypothetical protein
MFSDKYPPSVRLLSPTNNQVVGKDFALVIDIDEPLCDVYSKIDDGDFYLGGNYSGQYSTTVPVTNYGIRTITVYAVDRANNKSQEVSVTIDRQAVPEIKVNTPNYGTILNSKSIIVEGFATVENHDLINQIQYSLNSATYITVPSSNNFMFVVNNLIEGKNHIVLNAISTNGKTNTTSPILVIVDTIKPTIAIVSHTNNQEEARTYILSGTASDTGTGISKVYGRRCTYCGWEENYLANWSFRFGNNPPGEMTNYIYAIDNAGNVSETETVVVIIDAAMSKI